MNTEDLRIAIDSTRLVNESLFAGVDMDAVLDARDAPEFSGPWESACATVQAKTSGVAAATLAELRDIQDATFIRVFGLTGSDDMAAYVSEDLELIWVRLLWDDACSWRDQLKMGPRRKSDGGSGVA